MDHAYEDLGTRVLNAARMAVAMHLHQSLGDPAQNARRQVVIGGTGPHYVTDDAPIIAPVDRVARE